jgi:hypothetical protein
MYAHVQRYSLTCIVIVINSTFILVKKIQLYDEEVFANVSKECDASTDRDRVHVVHTDAIPLYHCYREREELEHTSK